MALEKDNKIERLQKELEDFTYIVSHDLSAPIRHIEQFSMLLTQRLSAREMLNPEEQQFLDILANSAHRARAMVTAIHKLSRINTAELDIRPVVLSDFIEKIASELKRHDHNRELLLTIEDDLGEIDTDSRILHDVIHAVLDNVIRFSPADTKPEVRIVGQTNEEKQLDIDFIDNGTGISSDLSEKVFQCFFQENRDKADIQHLGIGLTSARRGARRLNGDITVYSKDPNSPGWPRLILPTENASH